MISALNILLNNQYIIYIVKQASKIIRKYDFLFKYKRVSEYSFKACIAINL